MSLLYQHVLHREGLCSRECLGSATSPELGSISRLYELLQQAAIDTPVVGNQDGSYLTMKSNQGMVFGATTILSGFAGVFCDQGLLSVLFHLGILSSYSLRLTLVGYWQRVRGANFASVAKTY
jgi:hypothetical protein